ncbi:MAG: hypothetical protein WBR29_05100 [Gammaproteobacteria bacterium]
MRKRHWWILNLITHKQNLKMSPQLNLVIHVILYAIPVLLAWYVNHKPDSFLGRLAKILFATKSPAPAPGELEQDYCFRYSIWALKWVFQLFLIWIVCIYLFLSKQNNSITLQAIFYFVLPLLDAMVVGGFILLLLKSMFCKLRTTERIFDEDKKVFIETKMPDYLVHKRIK